MQFKYVLFKDQLSFFQLIVLYTLNVNSAIFNYISVQLKKKRCKICVYRLKKKKRNILTYLLLMQQQ